MVVIRNGKFKCPNGHVNTSFIRFTYDENTDIEGIIMYCGSCHKEFILA